MDEWLNEFLSDFRLKHSVNLEEITNRGLIAISGERIDNENYAGVIVLEYQSGELLYSSGGPIRDGNHSYTADKALQEVLDSRKLINKIWKTIKRARYNLYLLIHQNMPKYVQIKS